MTSDEEYVREAIDLAESAVENGNTPFGSLLVVDNTVVQRSENTTVTDDDVTAHPELKLARWAARELDDEELADCTMYTSTAPCEMFATAVHYAGLDRVVFSVSAESLAELRGSEHGGFTCREIVDAKGGSTTVEGPVLENEGLAVHETFY
jgi:tRNA(Arg) A34 adenosine deaminase TadA